jgi:glucose/arabinose dehydrogenase
LAICCGLIPFLGNSQYKVDPTTLKIKVVAKNLEIPWDLVAEQGSHHLWFTEKKGTVNRMEISSGEVNTILNLDTVFVSKVENSGLHSLAFHPHNDSNYFYCHYAYDSLGTRLTRFEYDPVNYRILSQQHLIPHIDGARSHNGSRMVFGPDGKLYISIGDAYQFQPAQDLNSPNGKVLRLNSDGSIPLDNPFLTTYVWSYGHRNPQGLTFGPHGLLYNSEHGPTTDDELNLVEKGKNYGWPMINGFCDLPSEKKHCKLKDLTDPIKAWTPTVAPSGLTYFNHESIPEWENSLLQALLKARKLAVLHLDSAGRKVLEQTGYLDVDYYRLRDVEVAPNGKVYISTSNLEVSNPPKRRDDDKIIEISNVDYNYDNRTSSAKFPKKPFVKIWVNEKDGQLQLKFREADVALELQLTTYYGGELYSDSFDTTKKTYAIGFFPETSGTYFLKMTLENGDRLIRRMTYTVTK